MKKKKVVFHTLGCKLNFSETSSIARMFEERGFVKTDFEKGADVFVINTCSVTENADKECRMIVRNALKISPNAFVAVIGCYAQLKSAEIAKIEGVDLVLGAKEKFELLNYLDNLDKKEFAEIHSCEIEQANFFVDSYSFGNRTRAFLKVQDGCDYTCTYCTIPLARGKSRSDTIQNVIKNANEVVKQGVKEIVLTGVNIGDFSQEGKTFFDLIRALDEVEGIERIRISSIEPNLLNDEIIEFVATSKKFVPHFHIPLQSGSDKILGLMKRRYRRELYSERVAKIKSLMPHCCIGVDVIAGFPGETEKDFFDTYNFLNELDISYLHVFTYSERPNTDAVTFDGVVPMNERRKRNKMLRILSAKKSRYFYEQNIGSVRKVLFEVENQNGMIQGFTDNYIKVKTEFDSLLIKKNIEVKLTAIDVEGFVQIKKEEFIAISL